MKTVLRSISATRPYHAHIAAAAAHIAAGDLVAMPTETVYGLAADAHNPTAVARIFVAKGRPTTDPLIVHIADIAQLAGVAADVPATFALLAETFWPGPLTILLPRHPSLDRQITAGLDTVAVRMPAHPVALALIRACGTPLVAPSANLFSHPSPTTGLHVMHDLDGRIAMVLDAGPCRIGVESTIVDITQSPARILRQGDVSAEQLSTVLGEVQIVTRTIDVTQAAPAPGMLLKHYAPRTPLMLLRGSAAAVRRSVVKAHAQKRIIWLCYREDERFAGMRGIDTMCLGSATDSAHIARSLFAALRAADAEGYALIVIAEPRGDGVAAAVRDRLYRAAEGVVHTLT